MSYPSEIRKYIGKADLFAFMIQTKAKRIVNCSLHAIRSHPFSPVGMCEEIMDKFYIQFLPVGTQGEAVFFKFFYEIELVHGIIFIFKNKTFLLSPDNAVLLTAFSLQNIINPL